MEAPVNVKTVTFSFNSQDFIRLAQCGFERISDFAKKYFKEVISAGFLILSLSIAPISTFIAVPLGFGLGVASVVAKDKLLKNENSRFIMTNLDNYLLGAQGFASVGTYILSGSYILSTFSGWYSGLVSGALIGRYVMNLRTNKEFAQS